MPILSKSDSLQLTGVASAPKSRCGISTISSKGIVAIAIDDLVAEGVGIEFEVGFDLFLDINVLSVELVFLGRLGSAEILIQRFI